MLNVNSVDWATLDLEPVLEMHHSEWFKFSYMWLCPILFQNILEYIYDESESENNWSCL